MMNIINCFHLGISKAVLKIAIEKFCYISESEISLYNNIGIDLKFDLQ